MPILTSQLSENASFSVEDILDNKANKKISFFYADPEKKHNDLILETWPPDANIRIDPMTYDEQRKGWVIDIEKANDASELFMMKENETVLQDGFISLKEGIQQPVNKILGKAEGKLEKFMLSKQGTIEKKPEDYVLNPEERFITVYTPPGYNKERVPPYNLQVTLDGGQYLWPMNMNVVLDNLTLAQEIEPVVAIFISPCSGPPDPKEEGFGIVMPKGYPLSMRLKEYSCNPEFADDLAALPATLRTEFNVTDAPENTTLWGMSKGGLQAEYTALLHPETFGNVVAQSPEAWNIPIQNGEKWRAGIKDIKDDSGNDMTWATATAELPLIEGPHNEYITLALREGVDAISGRDINPDNLPLKMFFDAGKMEEAYDAGQGSANLVESTRLFAEALEEKGHTVVNGQVHMLPGGHHTMTWMRNIADAARSMNPPAPVLALSTAASQKDSSASPTPEITAKYRQLMLDIRQSKAAKTEASDPMLNIDDDRLKQTMATAQIPGVSMAFIDSKQTVLSKVVGKTAPDVTEAGANTDVNSKTKFGAASLSKPVFAYLTLKLMEQGKLSLNLDKPLHAFLPLTTFCQDTLQKEMGNADAQTAQALTARMVLSHQTGMPITGAAKFDFEPGKEYGYSGVPLMYLQEIIEAQTGKTLEVLAEEVIFAPLGMAHSSFLAPTTFDNPEPKANAGNSVYTTASDYAKFCMAWLNDPSATMQEAFQPQVFMTKDHWANAMGVAQDDCEHVAWGLGVGLETNDEGVAIRAFHAGDMNQWRGQVAMNLEDKTAMVYFANGIEHNNANGHVLSDLIIKPTIEAPHAMNWFFNKFAFARTTEGDWKEDEAKNMQKVGEYLQGRSAANPIQETAINRPDSVSDELTDNESGGAVEENAEYKEQERSYPTPFSMTPKGPGNL